MSELIQTARAEGASEDEIVKRLQNLLKEKDAS
jgi:hypothetical protein